jgi:hypothetical protein
MQESDVSRMFPTTESTDGSRTSSSSPEQRKTPDGLRAWGRHASVDAEAALILDVLSATTGRRCPRTLSVARPSASAGTWRPGDVLDASGTAAGPRGPDVRSTARRGSAPSGDRGSGLELRAVDGRTSRGGQG